MPPDMPPVPPLDMPAIIQQCAPNVGFDTMKAIVHVESKGRPHVIGYKVAHANGVYTLTQQPKDKAEAVSWARWMLDNGYRFDAGPAQVNSTNFRAYGLTAESVFEPCTNIKAGAAILTDAYQAASRQYGPGQQALLAAISAYNSGNFVTGFRNGYVQKVAAAAGVPAAQALPASAPPLKPTGAAPKPAAKRQAAPAGADASTASAPAENPYYDRTNPLTAPSEVDAFKNPTSNFGEAAK